jgi:hypothetical protein
MRLNSFVFVFVLFMASCSKNDNPSEFTPVPVERTVIHLGPWSVEHNNLDAAGMTSNLVFVSVELADQLNETDSLNHDGSVPDSIRFSRKWYTGASSVLLFTVTIPDTGDELVISRAREVCESASILKPEGIRSVFLSDRTGSQIDEERASADVVPPPEVSHYMQVFYQPDSMNYCLEVIDSLVVDFRESNADSLTFTFINRDSSSVIFSTAGVFRRSSASNQYSCFADSSGIYTGVFRNRFRINIPYPNSQGQVSVQARLTSAFLSGDGYCPLSSTTENYSVQFFLPDSIIAWTPLKLDEDTQKWNSDPGGIIGGLPVAIGSYTESYIYPRYRLFVLNADPISDLDSIAVTRIAATLYRTLDFPSADFSFVEIFNPDRQVVVSAFGGILFSRGSLECLNDVSSWDETILSGNVPAGSEILIKAARGILLQSLQLDQILSDMLAAWVPIRYFEANTEDEQGLWTLRQAYLKYYLFNSEVQGGNGSINIVEEFALSDPMLSVSPLREFVTGGKGVIVLEYLNSLRMLNRIPYLLQDFTHASSGNFWLKVSSSLRVSSETRDYSLLRSLLYQPGIPQVHARWWENEGKVFIELQEIQPGSPFNLNFNQCQLYFPDTVLTRTLIADRLTGLLQCSAGSPGSGPVTAIDLNHTGVIPADIMYERVIAGDNQ